MSSAAPVWFAKATIVTLGQARAGEARAIEFVEESA
jgi:hypothetical protein